MGRKSTFLIVTAQEGNDAPPGGFLLGCQYLAVAAVASLAAAVTLPPGYFAGSGAPPGHGEAS
eukprot:604432-Ditylum_brightwellii.AAC.1